MQILRMEHLSLCLKTRRDQLFVIMSGERSFHKNGALTKKEYLCEFIREGSTFKRKLSVLVIELLEVCLGSYFYGSHD